MCIKNRLLLISGDTDTCINAILDIIPLLEEVKSKKQNLSLKFKT
jgi:hypothetical protein